VGGADTHVTETPLARKIGRLIEANGPMPVADYMALCLSDPEYGYYMKRDPFGASGDFTTAPEVSQMFGEIVGAWLIHAWELAGAPALIRLVELGPGRGTLMADVLRVAERVPAFRQAASIHLVETSPALNARQQQALSPFGVDANCHSAFDTVPEGSLLLIANEFFDTLPVRQYVRAEGAWQERAVGVDIDGRLCFGIGAGRLADIPEAPDGSILEIRPGGEALMAEIAARIVRFGGAALIMDYGHAQSSFGDTLQAVRQHGYADPLAALGEADLTAHVDFAALGRAAESEGAAVHGPMMQGEFLLALGLKQRAARLAAGAGEQAREMVATAVERLSGPSEMGRLFKVLAITRRGIQPLPFPAI
jgi:SAM-dependent MidA family methyltransferase